MVLETVDLTPRIGTEIKTDLQTLLSGSIAKEVRALLERRGVVLFRGIENDDIQLLDIARTMGNIEEADGRLLKISFDEKEAGIYGRFFPGTFFWHMDRTYDNVPPLATVVTPRILTSTGGETEFCNTYAAYEDLPEEEKKYLDGLRIVHSLEASMRPAFPDPSEEDIKMWRTKPVRVHPLVWHHRSGRKSLALGMSAEQVLDMTRTESDALLKRLMDWATQPKYVYRHKWQMNDILMWDNTGTMHRAMPYDRSSKRLLHRYTLVGEEPITPVYERTSSAA